MTQGIRELLVEWNKTHDGRDKLQYAYGVAALAMLLVAGLIGLVNYNLGQSLLFVAIALGLVFVANAVVWALLDSLILSRLKASKAPRKK